MKPLKTPIKVSLIDSFILSHRSIIDTVIMRKEMVSFSNLKNDKYERSIWIFMKVYKNNGKIF